MRESHVRILTTTGGLALIGIALVGFWFVWDAVSTGSIVYSGKYGKATFLYSKRPMAFLVTLSIYLVATCFAAWGAKTTLIDEPKWRRRKSQEREPPARSNPNS
jgi:hypothetical protein